MGTVEKRVRHKKQRHVSPEAGLSGYHICIAKNGPVSAILTNGTYMIVGTERRHGFSQNDVDRQWQQIVNKVRKKQVDGVIVTNMRAVTDTLVDAAIKIAQIQAAGGVVVTVDDGKLLLDIRGFRV